MSETEKSVTMVVSSPSDPPGQFFLRVTIFAVVVGLGVFILERRGYPVISILSARVRALSEFAVRVVRRRTRADSSETGPGRTSEREGLTAGASDAASEAGASLSVSGAGASASASAAEADDVEVAKSGGGAAGAAVFARRASEAPARALPALLWSPAGSEYSPLLSARDLRALLPQLPSKCVGRDMRLLFSTQRDGYSLSTLYARARDAGPTLLVVLDDSSAVFGAFAPADWAGDDFAAPGSSSGHFARGSVGYMASPVRGLTHGRGAGGDAWFGDTSAFLFSLVPSFAAFRATRANAHFQLAKDECLAFGGSGSAGGRGAFGLWLDASFEKGCSAPCDTFANAPLTAGLDAAGFVRVVRVELWAWVTPGALPGTATARAAVAETASLARAAARAMTNALGARRGSRAPPA